VVVAGLLVVKAAPIAAAAGRVVVRVAGAAVQAGVPAEDQIVVVGRDISTSYRYIVH